MILKKKQILLNLSEDIHKDLKMLAVEKGTSMTQIIIAEIKKVIEKHKKSKK